MQPTLERRLAQTEHSGGLRGREALDIAQHQGRALIDRQPGDRGVEGASQVRALGAVGGLDRTVAGGVLALLV